MSPACGFLWATGCLTAAQNSDPQFSPVPQLQLVWKRSERKTDEKSPRLSQGRSSILLVPLYEDMQRERCICVVSPCSRTWQGRHGVACSVVDYPGWDLSGWVLTAQLTARHACEAGEVG